MVPKKNIKYLGGIDMIFAHSSFRVTVHTALAVNTVMTFTQKFATLIEKMAQTLIMGAQKEIIANFFTQPSAQTL